MKRLKWTTNEQNGTLEEKLQTPFKVRRLKQSVVLPKQKNQQHFCDITEQNILKRSGRNQLSSNLLKGSDYSWTKRNSNGKQDRRSPTRANPNHKKDKGWKNSSRIDITRVNCTAGCQCVECDYKSYADKYFSDSDEDNDSESSLDPSSPWFNENYYSIAAKNFL